jgi:hypothetical protein
MAKLRINQVPATAEELRRRQSAPPIPLPALGDSFDEDQPKPVLKRAEAIQIANGCVAHLKKDPDNIEAREELARILTEQLGQVDQGIEQLALLLDVPGQEDARRAEWLALMASWSLKYKHDQPRARHLLERVIHEFSGSPQALAAKRRLMLLKSADAQS